MTRKDVCRATGLSIKTLRLYEEKGLIAPERQYRNGREYRIYTPELVEELNKIVTLRRALFTMEEIRTMQESPDAIPGIFQDYRLWLQAQEQQFRSLRQAAERIDPGSLQSVEGLISDLAQAAAQLPLPQMDRKPDFKHIDAMEEPPRHVSPQTNLDDTIPDARVFRQMNLRMDGDRSNDIGVAFGQLRDIHSVVQKDSGPVREKVSAPKWLNVLGGVLSTLLLIVGVLCGYQALAQQWFEPGLWRLFVILLLLRLAAAAIPSVLSRRRWLAEAQQKDQMEGGAAYAAAAKAEQKRRTRIIALSVLGGILVILLIAVLCRIMYRQAHPQADLNICFVSRNGIQGDAIQYLEDTFTPLAVDTDGDGQQTVHLVSQYLSTWPADQTMTEWELDTSVEQGDYTLYLLSPTEGEETPLDSSYYCAALPADFGGGYLVELTDCPGLQAAGLQGLEVYGLISQAAAQTEYDMAVSMLRALLQGA